MGKQMLFCSGMEMPLNLAWLWSTKKRGKGRALGPDMKKTES
jgi:hypothetical protein